jgi:hypothetical protein
MDEFDQRQDSLLNNALNELPLAPLPADFTKQVMRRIHLEQNEAGSAAPVGFRLHFLDIVLALCWSLILVFIWLTTLWWAGLLRIDWLPEAGADIFFVEQLSLSNPSILLAGIMLLLLEMCVLGLVGLNLLGEQPPTS